MPNNSVHNEQPLARSTLELLLRELLRASSVIIASHARIEAKIDQHFANLSKEIQMSQSNLSAQLDAATASLKADLGTLLSEFSGAAPGDQITQAQIDAITALDTSVKAVIQPPADTPPATPAA